MDEKEKVYVCPMCKGRKWIDSVEHGLDSPSDKTFFIKCILCNGKGFVVE